MFERAHGLKMIRVSLSFFLGAFLFVPFSSALPLSPEQETRVESLLQSMELSEKIKVIHGDPSGFENWGVPRLGVPSIKIVDGPIGVRLGTATAFPAGVAMGASFDLNLMRDVGRAMALETLAKGRDMLLGPCVNIHRAPQGGRNFESYGEDPYLTSRFAEAWVESVQGQGVIASTKHYAANDQEFERMTIDVRVDERTLHEIHFPAFKAAVNAGTMSVMSSYNRLNGKYASENPSLLTSVLKDQWGFQGFVISDWGANHSTVASANAGLDVEMPAGEFWANGQLETAIKEGKVALSLVNDKVRRVLRALVGSGTIDRTAADRPHESVVNSLIHQNIARRAAADGMVLLKNNKVLPLDLNSPQKIAVIGPNAAVARNNGGGSSRVVGPHDISSWQGLNAQVRRDAGHSLAFAAGIKKDKDYQLLNSENIRPSRDNWDLRGFRGEYFNNMSLEGAPVLTRIDSNLDFNWGGAAPESVVMQDYFSARWTGIYRSDLDGQFELRVRSDDGVRLYLDGVLIIDKWVDQPATTYGAAVNFVAGQDYEIKVEYYEKSGGAEIHLGRSPDADSADELLAEAVELARNSDVALVFVGWNEALEHEGRDRSTLSLPEGQETLVAAVAQANPNTVVIINGGGSVTMPWAESVGAIVQAWYPGQEGGHAIADLLLGVRNFSAKLPVSFYARAEDASSYGNFPGRDGVVEYKEGLFVGYRHLDSRGIAPLFPFGFGLSYTQFEISDLNFEIISDRKYLPRAAAQVRVTNTGDRPGAEVVQVYVHPNSPRVIRPEQELKAFQKVWLNPGESTVLRFELGHEAFAHYDVALKSWRVDAGLYEIRIGNSSRNLLLKQSMRIK